MWDSSGHAARNLACVSCHSVHAPKSEQAQLGRRRIELCATCHKLQAQKQLRTSHMPVREGKMTCSSCHNPHGSTNVSMLRVGNYINESCTSCHAEKRGPFLWEHAAGRECAARATTRTARTTIGCWSCERQRCVSAATSGRGTRRPSTTGRRSRSAATAWSTAAASVAISRFTAPTTRRATRSPANRRRQRCASELSSCSPRSCWPPRPARTRKRPRRPTEPEVGSVDFGGQFSTMDGDEARYQTYKDMRSSALLDAFRYTRENRRLGVQRGRHSRRLPRSAIRRHFRNYQRAKISFPGTRFRSSTARTIEMFRTAVGLAVPAGRRRGIPRSTTTCRGPFRRCVRCRRAQRQRTRRRGRRSSSGS